MYQDEIISEVWANREAYVFKHSHNLGSMIKELMKRQKISGRLLVDRRLKPNKCVEQGQATRGSFKSL